MGPPARAVTLLAYQQALCDMVASPELCVRVRRDADTLASYDLTDRERHRLIDAAKQRGMSINCTLHRVNRITPVYTYLPFTCRLLGDALMPEAERYWGEKKLDDMQFHPETLRFATYLRRRLGEGAIDEPYLDDVLRFELAVNELSWNIGPRTRVVYFAHEPGPLLSALADGRKPAAGAIRADGPYRLMIDGRDGAISLSLIEGIDSTTAREDTPLPLNAHRPG